MLNKDDALQDVVSAIRRHNISLDEIKQLLESNAGTTVKPSASVLSKLLAYIGGIFVFAGIGVFMSMYWDDFGSATRVIVTLGVGLVAFVMGLACLHDKRYEKAATPLFIISSILQPMGILVMLNEYSSGGDARHGLIFMSLYMLIQQLPTFWVKRSTILAFSAIVFGSVLLANISDLLDIDHELVGTVVGISLLSIAYALQQSRHLAIAPFWYFVGGVLLMWSAFEWVEGGVLEIFYLGLAALMIFLSTHARSRTLLLVGTLSMLSYIGYFTAENFADTLGWPIALVILGVVLIGMSALALRINNKYIKQ